MPDSRPVRGRHVYLSYAPEDGKEAAEIARELEQRGIAVRLDRADVAWGESWAAHVSSAVETSDTFVMVVSQDSTRHVDDWEEAATALDRRGIDVVAVAVPPPVIQNLAGRPVLEYAGPSAGGRLAERIELGAAINFDRLSWEQFETLVADLLSRIGYDTVQADGGTAVGDSGPDFQATHASLGEEQFVVEVKAYRRSGRISVNEIQRLAALVKERGARGILVTSGQLTSVARQVLDRLNGTGAQLQVLDGPALRQMLVANPDIAERHLIAPEPGAAPQ